MMPWQSKCTAASQYGQNIHIDTPILTHRSSGQEGWKLLLAKQKKQELEKT
jgi:hypothetical protein